jgi:hypothetical protein
MTLEQLLTYLDANLEGSVLDGNAADTLSKSLSDEHVDPMVGEIIRRIAEDTGCTSVAQPLERAETVKALGPLRLKYMADDAPVDAFRTLEMLVRAVDGAFNEETLRQQRGSQ